MSPITEQDSEQNERIKELETKIKTLEEEVDKYQDKEHQALNQRIRLIEKQVWGAGAVVAAVVTGYGLYQNIQPEPIIYAREDHNHLKTLNQLEPVKMAKENRRYIEQVILPSYGISDNWRNQYHDEWVRKGGFKD